MQTAQNVRSAGPPCDAPFKAVHQFVVLLGVEVSVTIEYDGYRRVARHHGDLLRVRAVGDPEGDGGVPEIMNAEGSESGGLDCRAQKRRRKSEARIGKHSGDRNTNRSAATLAVAS